MSHPPRYNHAQTDAPLRMIYYAHTAEDPEGKRLPESSGQWQPLRTHLENVANLAFEKLLKTQTGFRGGDRSRRRTTHRVLNQLFQSEGKLSLPRSSFVN